MKPLLRQNAELRKDNIWNWSLPAFVTKLPDGRNLNVCPQAGACAKVCYAMNGSYRFPSVKASHQHNLTLILDDIDGWRQLMIEELAHKRFRPTGTPRTVDGLESHDHLHPTVRQLLDDGAAAVRIHDGGDFFSAAYLWAWLAVASAHPDVLFYAYTKEVTLFRALDPETTPANFLWVYSLGGKQDHLLDLEVDRHADVFPTAEEIEREGYFDQTPNDLLCVLAPSNKIGIPSNRIPAFRKRQGDQTFGQMERGMVRHSRERLHD
jgi:hypothetical protein